MTWHDELAVIREYHNDFSPKTLKYSRLKIILTLHGLSQFPLMLTFQCLKQDYHFSPNSPKFLPQNKDTKITCTCSPK